jgi:hypothetical protein
MTRAGAALHLSHRERRGLPASTEASLDPPRCGPDT